ncbi:MAG: CusA/CzcA family heavy metal efflux RND transporter [Lacibacter sp.]
MLSAIIRFSVKNKLIIGLFIIALTGYGSYQFTKLPIDAVPDITNNQVQVITVAPSLGATDIERLITFPIELVNNNIQGLHEIRSFSRFGLSLVTIVFDDGVDIYWARQQVAERIQQVKDEIPDGVGNISLGPVTTGLGEIYQYTVRAKEGYQDKYSAMELRTLQDWVVRRQLLGVKGVADVSSFGGRLKQYEIAVNANKLQSYGITMSDVFDALEKNNQNTGGAYIEKGPTVLYIRSEGLVGSIDDINSILIKNTSGGGKLLVRDVADVRFGSATRYGAMCFNDEGEVAGAVVMMLKGANSSEVIKNVKERVAQIQQTLPEGVMIEPFLDRTKMVNNAINTVKTNLIEGALIVLFVLILFLGNLRSGFIVASVIPLAMMFAVILMNQFGVIGNLMSLGALDFGLIVDGAVFIVEAVLHQLTHSKHFAHVNRLNQQQMDEEVMNASSKMSRSVVFGQIIILIVYLPTFTLQGIEGKMFIPMAQTIAFALLGAFILSLTYVPMMSALLMKKTISHKKTFSDKMMDYLDRSYQKNLTKSLNYPKVTITVAVTMFLVSVFVLTRMGGEFIPALEEGDFAVDTRVLTGSSLTTTIESTQKAAHILKTRFPEVKQVVTKIGSGEIPTDPMPMEAADMMVILKDKKEWTSAKTFPELAEKMTEAVSEVPGITVSFQYPVQMRFNELMTGAKQDVVCKIFGENMDTLAHYAEQLGNISSTVNGTKELYVEPVAGMPQIIINYNRAAIAQYGLNISDINKVVNTGLAGQSTGFVYEGEKRFDMVVRLDGEQKKNVDDVRNLLIPTPSGSQIPLYQLAGVDIKEGPNQVQREDAKRRIIVGFNVRGRDVQSVVTELQGKVNSTLKLPAGYYITYGGSFENLNAAKARLSIAVPVALLLIFILLFFSFNSIKQGLLIYSAIPLSATGGIFALALRGMPFSISAGVGFIALFGVAVLNGIVLIAEFNRLKAEGWTDPRRIVVMGTKIRLRPVAMTAFVASLGILPMAISTGSGAEVQRPLATVLIGGLLVATFLTLYVLPVLYIMFETGFKKKKKMKAPVAHSIVWLLMVFGVSATANAQTPVTLQAAVDTALKNNLAVKNEKLVSEYRKMMIGSAKEIPHANLAGEFGQFNSTYFDTKFGLSQSFSFPKVYTAQKNMLTEEWKNSTLRTAAKEADLKREVTTVFYQLLYMQQKKQLLLYADSLYAAFYRLTELRLQKGESNVLEKATAETQLGQIRLQLQQLKKDEEIEQMRFQLLLNSTTVFTVSSTELKMVYSAAPYEITAHPSLQVLKHEEKLADAVIKVQQSKLLPEVSAGIFSTSIKGTGADNNYYAASHRFQSVQVGIGIPVFTKAQKVKISSAKFSKQIVENNYLLGTQLWANEIRTATEQYNKYKDAVSYFEQSGLKNAELILSAANRQFSSGLINYLEWFMLVNQATAIRNDYLDAVKNLNGQIILLNYYSNK